MSWVENEMSWVEVDGFGWRWVHSLVIPKKMENLRNRIDLILKNNEKKLFKMDIRTN